MCENLFLSVGGRVHFFGQVPAPLAPSLDIKTAVHGTLEMTFMAVKFNFQQVLLKTLIPTMNTLKDMAVLNIIKTDGKFAPEAKR